MQEHLQWLATCGRPWAEQRAQIALDLVEQYQHGTISTEEYQELMQDLVRSDELNSAADDQDIKNMLVSCIMIGAKLA